jgi:murein L,D-transpeptidase YcbB/YkuD
MVKEDLVAAVVAKMQEMRPGDHQDIPAPVHEADTNGMTLTELTSMTWLQQRLNALGNQLTVDGVGGPATKAAVEAFQKKAGLTVDGIAGPVTRAALKQAAPA